MSTKLVRKSIEQIKSESFTTTSTKNNKNIVLSKSLIVENFQERFAGRFNQAVENAIVDLQVQIREMLASDNDVETIKTYVTNYTDNPEVLKQRKKAALDDLVASGKIDADLLAQLKALL